MITRTSCLASALHRLSPIADGFALRWRNVVSPPMRHQKSPLSHHLVSLPSDLTVRLSAQIAAYSPPAGSQIPIAV